VGDGREDVDLVGRFRLGGERRTHGCLERNGAAGSVGVIGVEEGGVFQCQWCDGVIGDDVAVVPRRLVRLNNKQRFRLNLNIQDFLRLNNKDRFRVINKDIIRLNIKNKDLFRLNSTKRYLESTFWIIDPCTIQKNV